MQRVYKRDNSGGMAPVQNLCICQNNPCIYYIKTTVMKTKDLLKRIEEIFKQKLQIKTGWGRNEISLLYSQSVNEALMELADTVAG